MKSPRRFRRTIPSPYERLLWAQEKPYPPGDFPLLPAAWTLLPFETSYDAALGLHQWVSQLWCPLEQYPRRVSVTMHDMELWSYDPGALVDAVDKRMWRQVRHACYVIFAGRPGALHECGVSPLVLLDTGWLPAIELDASELRRERARGNPRLN